MQFVHLSIIGVNPKKHINFNLKVDIDILATDDEKPQVGNVNLVINEVNPVEGEATVTFNRLDSGGSSIVNYFIILKNEDTGVETTYETGNSITSYTISNLSPGNYSVKVYGQDEAGNSLARNLREEGGCRGWAFFCGSAGRPAVRHPSRGGSAGEGLWAETALGQTESRGTAAETVQKVRVLHTEPGGEEAAGPRALSRAFQRDARRYDGGFRLYD